MQVDELLTIVTNELNARKAENVTAINVIGKTSFTDYIVIATGTSHRHIKALCNYVALALKDKGITPKGTEGRTQRSEWVLMDLGDIILHIMIVQTREFYQLEKLWGVEKQAENTL